MATQSGTVQAGVAEHQRQRLRSIAIVPQTGCQYALEHGYDIAIQVDGDERLFAAQYPHD
jgi:hypothetical protein